MKKIIVELENQERPVFLGYFLIIIIKYLFKLKFIGVCVYMNPLSFIDKLNKVKKIRVFVNVLNF